MAPNTTKTISCKTWNSPVEYPSRESNHDIEECEGNMLNAIFKEKVQGRKHPGRRAFAEPETLVTESLNMQFEMNRKIKIQMIVKTTMVK